jgi:Flp pilus assembly protein TadD
MRQRDYASAASLLTRVLEKEKDDLEAGINMAIVEIKTHRLDEARKRLAGLREIYQANTLIPELIRETGG